MGSVLFRVFTGICLGSIALLSRAPVVAEQPIRATALATIRKQAIAVIESASPAVVRFAYGDERKLQFGCGVIVSAGGHIAVSGPVRAVLDDDLLDLRLSDGRRVRGQALGWSSEFGFGMLKITDAGEWPHVKVNGRAEVGEVCVALGYPRGSPGTERGPDVALGVITKVADGQWLTTSHPLALSAHPVFNLDGELLGLCCKTPVGGDPLYAASGLIEVHWDDLVAGRNLDRMRLLPEATQQQQITQAPQQSEPVAVSVVAKAKAVSVRISDTGAEASLASGVIVTPDGYVITCGHHNRMPGTKMTLSLHDGRSADAVVLGIDLVADVGVLKIIDSGRWPFAEMGRSAAMHSGDHCVLMGYPTNTRGTEPWVFDAQIIKPTYTLPARDEWYCQFWTSKFPQSIQGASGGGVFDAEGRVIGVMLGGADNEMQHARIELFRKNWDLLAAGKHVEEVDPKLLAETVDSLHRLAGEFSGSKRP